MTPVGNSGPAGLSPTGRPTSVLALYAGAGAAALLAAQLGLARPALSAAVGVAAVAAVVVGTSGRSPARARPWWALAAGHVLRLAAPGGGWYLHLACYPLSLYALLSLARARGDGRGNGALVDAAIVTTAAALVVWTVPLGGRALSAGRAVAGLAGLLVLAAAVRLLLTGGIPGAADVLVAAGTAVLAMVDTAHSLFPAVDVDVPAAAGALLLGAAALSPAPGPARPSRADDLPGLGRLALLSSAAIVAPVLHVAGHLRGWPGAHEVGLTVVGGIVYVLVIVRLGLVMREHLERSQRERGRLLELTMEAAEAERTRVAVEIHDGPIQRLAALGFVLDRGDRAVRHGDIPGGLALYERARAVVVEEIGSLRRLMAGLRPPSLDQKGLEAALQDELGRFSREQGVIVVLRSELGDTRLHPLAETVLYRVAQEALVNVGKHAAARTVRIDLAYRDDLVRMTVTDDGRGFDPERADAASGEHFGLAAMRERVVRAGGSLRLVSRPSEGTAVVVELPGNRESA